nr:hypothetical protein 17 [bacterium]
MLPLSKIVSKVTVKAGDASGLLQEKIINSINDYYQVLWNAYHWKAVTLINQPFTAYSGKVRQVLPADIDIIFAISEQQNSITLTPSSPYIYNAKYIGQVINSDIPLAYTRGANAGVISQPSKSSSITLTSSASSDIIPTVRIWGKDINGIEISESLRLNGVSPVTTIKEFSVVSDVVKTDFTNGVITISTDSETLDVITSHKYKNTYACIYLQSCPDKDYTLYVSGKKRFKPLLFNEDTPVFECENALFHYAYGEILQERGDEVGANAEYEKAEKIISGLVGQQVQGEDREDTMPIIPHTETDTPVLIR